MSNTEHHIYYDLSLLNRTNDFQIANINETRSLPLLKNPSEYHLSIIKFTIPTSMVPIFIYPNANNAAINTSYSVTIRYSNTDFMQNIIYVPNNNFSSTNERYFYIYSYQQFLSMINTAFNSSYLALKTAFPGATVTTPPYMTYDSSTGLFSLIAEQAYASGYEVFMNNDLYTFFDNFDSFFYGYNNVNGKDYKIFIKNNGNNEVTVVPPLYTSIASYKMVQEYSSTFMWNDVRSLIFTSNLIGVRNEAYNLLLSNSVSTGSLSRNILTDYDFNIASGSLNSTLRSYIQYIPVGEYRLIDLINTSPLYQLDIQILFQTQDGTIHPLYIAPGEFISIKLMFRDKYIKSGF